MRDNNFSTYAVIHFESGGTFVEIEVTLGKLYNVTGVHIYGDRRGPLNDFRVFAGEEYCGYCWERKTCSTKCSSPIVASSVLIRKYVPTNNTYTTLRIFEFEVHKTEVQEDPDDGSSSGMSVATEIGLVAVVVGIILLITLAGICGAEWKDKKFLFYRDLRDGYALASSRGARSGQFQIQHHHPKKKATCKLYLRRGYEHTGPKQVVNFIINVDMSAEQANIMVKFNETGEADNAERVSETQLSEVEMNNMSDQEFRTRNTDVFYGRGGEEGSRGENGRESRTTVERLSATPSAPEITELPPPSYQASQGLGVRSEVPSYDEVITNSAAFSEVIPIGGPCEDDG